MHVAFIMMCVAVRLQGTIIWVRKIVRKVIMLVKEGE